MKDSTFTAAQIATALGAARPCVRRSLNTVPADGKLFVQGNETSVWKVASLPVSMVSKLNRRAKAKGYRNIEHLLRQPSRRFESSVPINQLAEAVQQRAMKLRAAMAIPLARHAEGLSGSELEDLGMREFRRAFDFEISTRHWRSVFNRTLDRDAGENQWDRLDLYLDARPHAAKAKRIVRDVVEVKEAEGTLLRYASEVRDRSKPTAQEKALLWITAFEHTLELVEAGASLTAARKTMREALWKCGVTLARNESSLRQLWWEKEKAWRAADGSFEAVKDRRSEASGYYRTPEIPQSDLDLVIGFGVKFGGRISQAWRHCVENNLLSPSVHFYYSGLWFASKSYVPKEVRDAVTPDVRQLQKIHRGPRHAKLHGAHITRDWSKTAAGDWYQADDVTLNTYYHAPDERGKITLMRGQVLLMIDVRSTCILSFAMLDQRTYTSHTIRTLITRTCDAFGLPRRGFYFERGIWQSSRLLKGDQSVSDGEVSQSETEGGLRDLGLIFKHSKLPRSKPVERVIGQIQNIMEGGPGDAGRNEVQKGFERIVERKRLVESGKAKPEDYFLSWNQAEEALARACEEYNESRNDGQMTGGLCPQQAWARYQAEPLIRLSGKARYLLACHKKPVKVTRNGIRLQFGKKVFVYHDENTGRYEGQKVLAWFNPELPEVLSVTDMERENHFAVELSPSIDAMDASPEALEQELARIDGHNRYARHRYRAVARAVGLNPRPTYMDSDSARLGGEIEAKQQEALAARKDREQRAKKGRAALGDLGLATRADDNYDDRRIAAAKRVALELEQFSEENS